MKSAIERFNLVMNGEDLDNEGPSIDVEINVIEKEAEAADDAAEMNALLNDIRYSLDAVDATFKNIELNDTICSIIEKDGLTPTALKVLSTNKLYTNVWNIELPSVESLDSVGNNKAAVESVLSKAKDWSKKGAKGLGNAGIYIWNKLISLYNFCIKKFNDWTGKNAKIFDQIEYYKLNDDVAPEEAAEEAPKETKLPSPEATKKAEEKLEQANTKSEELAKKVEEVKTPEEDKKVAEEIKQETAKLDEVAKELKSNEKPASEVVKDVVSNVASYKKRLSTFGNKVVSKSALDRKIKRAEQRKAAAKRGNDNLDKNASDKEAFQEAASALAAFEQKQIAIAQQVGNATYKTASVTATATSKASKKKGKKKKKK